MDNYNNFQNMLKEISSGNTKYTLLSSNRRLGLKISQFKMDQEFIWRYYRILDLDSANAAVIPMLRREFDQGLITVDQFNDLADMVYQINLLIKAKEV